MENFDVAIVGGGIIGCSIAFELAVEKLKIVVLDKQKPGRESSWAAAGMLSPALDSDRDRPLVPLAKASLNLYPEFVGKVQEASGKRIDYVHSGTLQIFTGPLAEAERDEALAEHLELGIATEAITLAEARQSESALGVAARAVLRFPEEESVDPRSLMDALLQGATERGVKIRPGSNVTAMAGRQDCCTGVLLETGEEIRAKHVILAAGCFSGEIAKRSEVQFESVPTRPVRGQMLALRQRNLALHHVLRSRHGYLVPRADGRIVAGSTSEDAGFEKRVTAEGIGKIIEAVLELCGDLGTAEIVETWSGLRPGTPDDLPILGLSEMNGLILATGHYRNGILLAPITATLVRDWVIQGRTGVNTDAFSPSRFQPQTQN